MNTTNTTKFLPGALRQVRAVVVDYVWNIRYNRRTISIVPRDIFVKGTKIVPTEDVDLGKRYSVSSTPIVSDVLPVRSVKPKKRVKRAPLPRYKDLDLTAAVVHEINKAKNSDSWIGIVPQSGSERNSCNPNSQYNIVEARMQRNIQNAITRVDDVIDVQTAELVVEDILQFNHTKELDELLQYICFVIGWSKTSGDLQRHNNMVSLLNFIGPHVQQHMQTLLLNEACMFIPQSGSELNAFHDSVSVYMSRVKSLLTNPSMDAATKVPLMLELISESELLEQVNCIPVFVLELSSRASQARDAQTAAHLIHIWNAVRLDYIMQRDCVILATMSMPRPQAGMELSAEQCVTELEVIREERYPIGPDLSSPQPTSDSGSYGFSTASDTSEDTTKTTVLNLLNAMHEACADTLRNKDEARILSKVEAALWFIAYDWPRATNRCDVILSVVRLVNNIVGIENIARSGHWLVEMFKTEIQPQAGVEMFDMSVLFSESKKFTTSEPYHKIKQFACALMALSVSTGIGRKLTSEKFHEVWDMAKLVIGKNDIISTVMEFLAWLLKSGWSLLTGKTSIHSFFTTPSVTQMFDGRVARLDYIKAEIDAGREEECPFTSYGIEIDALRRLAADMERTVPARLKPTLMRQITVINRHWSEFVTKENSHPLRRAPFCVMFYGGSSTAKSCLLPAVANMLQGHCGLPRGPEYIFDHNVFEKHMTGFNNGKNTIFLDDCGNTAPQFAEKQCSSVLIDLVNNNKRLAVMADLESKGQYLIKPDLVLCTTNCEQLHAGMTSTSSISILRRPKWWVETRILPEFADEGGMMRADVNPNDTLDIWCMDVYQWTIQPNTKDSPMKKYVMRNVRFPAVMEFLCAEAKTHLTRQTELVRFSTSMKDLPVCQHGLFAMMNCRLCEQQAQQPQAGFESIKQSVSRAVEYAKIGFAYMSVKSDYKQHKMYHICVHALSEFVLLLLSFSFPVTFTVFVTGTFLNFLCAVSIAARKLYVAKQYGVYENLTIGMKHVLPAHNLKNAGKFVGLVSTVALMYTAYKSWKKLYVEPQGGGVSKEKKIDIERAPGVSNVKNWYTEQYIISPPKNLDLHTASADQIASAVKRRLYVARFLTSSDVSEEAVTCAVLPIMSETVIAPWHILLSGRYKFMEIYRASGDRHNCKRLVSIEGQWQRIGTTDLCIVSSPTIGDQKDIRCWFPSGSVTKDDAEKHALHNMGCQLVWAMGHRTGTDVPMFNVTRGVGKVNASSSMVSEMKESHGLEYWGGKYVCCMPTSLGLCGAVMISDRVAGPMIVGFHSGGATGTTNARFCAVFRNDIDDTITAMRSPLVPQSVMHQSADFVSALDFKGTNFEYTTKQGLFATSPYIAGEYDILGHNTSPARTFRSSVCITKWSEHLEHLGYAREHEAPTIINTYVPWNVWMTNVSTPSHIEAPYLKLGRDDYIEHVKKGIEARPDWNFEQLKPLAHEVVLAGLDGVTGIDAINRKTSMGIPYCRPKSEYIKPTNVPYPGITYPVDISTAMKREIEVMEMKLKAGERVYVAHRCNLKDEAVKIGKLKVRVFMGSPFAYLYLMRKYFLPFSAFMQCHPLLFETAVGIRCYSKEWTTLYNFLTKYSDANMVAGDYKAYDQKMEIALTKAAFEVLLVLCEMAGYTDEQMAVCRGLMTETIAGCYDVKGEWIGLTSANPSGHALTVIINSLANSIQVRAGYYKLKPAGWSLKFADVVALVTYGDDNIMGVSDSAPWFNHTELAAVLKLWGITYTMADKEAESVPYLPMDQCSFLKRTWRWCDQREMYLAPLEESSIMKTLHTYVASTAIDVNSQHAELLLSANREYFMYGYKLYAEKRAVLYHLAEKFDMLHYFPKMVLPDVAELDRWITDPQ